MFHSVLDQTIMEEENQYLSVKIINNAFLKK